MKTCPECGSSDLNAEGKCLNCEVASVINLPPKAEVESTTLPEAEKDLVKK